MLRVSDLHVSYGTSRVVRGVSFDVNAGEVVALLGRNGADSAYPCPLCAATRAERRHERLRRG